MNNLIPGGCFQTVMVNWITRRENSDMKYPPEIKPVTFSAVRQDPYPPIQWTLPPPKNKRNPEMKTRIRLFSKSIFYSDGNKPPGMHGLVKQRAQNNYRVLWLTAAVIVWKRLHGQQWRQDLKNWQYIQSCHIFGRDIKQGYKKPLAFQRTNISCLRRQTSGNFHD